MWYAALIDSCCHHFHSVIAVGTYEQVLMVREELAEVVPDGYHITVAEVKPFDVAYWSEIKAENVDYVTVNEQPVGDYPEFLTAKPIDEADWDRFINELEDC